MGLFKKKKTVIDYDAVFKEQYKSVNQLTQQAHQEMDYVIKESLYETHRELDLILATCKKRDIFMWAQLAIIKWNLGLIIDAVNARDKFVRQMRQHRRNSRIR